MDEDELISACIREKLDEGWEQDRAVAACLNMAREGTLSAAKPDSKSGSPMELKALKFDDSQVNIEERTFKGYASTFGNVDEVGDIIEQGAFSKTINERGPKGSKQIKVLWQHSEPLGIPMVMEEDSRGLYVEGKISKTRLGDEALELMRDGVVDRMSIGFSIPNGKSEWDDTMGVRKIKEVKLFEFSPVTFPANEAAVITGVKNLEGMIALAQSGHALKEVSLQKLWTVYRQLKALLESEPLQSTQGTQEPQIDPEILKSIQELKHFAETRLY
jgi:HK97 family phage prohead protease